MGWMNAELYHRIEKARRRDLANDAAKWRLLRAGRRTSGWLDRQRCWLLCQVGRWLVRLGRTLQSSGRYDLHPVQR